jgi:extracellular factor (EF) 3-hydroxypalmitic acid methyl ester biosynthesis protein
LKGSAVLPLNLIEPVVTFLNSQRTAVRGTLTSLQRRSLVLEIYNPYSIVQVSEVLSDLTVRAGSKVVYRGRAVVTSLLNTGLMAVVSVTLIDEWSDLDSTAGDIALIRGASRQFVDEWQNRFRISRSYQVVLSEMRAFLADTARWLDRADMTSVLPRDATGKLRDDVFQEIADPIVKQAAKHLDWFEAEADVIAESDVVIHRAFAQAALHPLLLRAPFVYRSFSKPLGYAGDYEMVNQIVSDPRQGDSTYFQVVNSAYLQTAVAAAHRNRIRVLCQQLTQMLRSAQQQGSRCRVLNVGCGPALEIQQLLSHEQELIGLDLTLIDFNAETLDYTRRTLTALSARSHGNVQVLYRHESVHDLLRRRTRERDSEPYQFIYCAGLFDYLSDKVCARLLSYFNEIVAPGGTVLVSNVHIRNPHRRVMEHVLDWHLIYRDEKSLASLLPQTAVDTETFCDETGVNVFCRFRVESNDR